MATDNWEEALDRWVGAGLLEGEAAQKVRAWEKARGVGSGRSKFALLAFAFGGLLLAAGVLLFVASNWQSLSPGGRFALLLVSVGAFHAGGAFSNRRSTGLSRTLHAVGTAALGGGIFLSGQSFHLAESWPEGFGLWALGAAVGLCFLRDWPHVLLTALLAPAWLWAEWTDYNLFVDDPDMIRPAASGTVLLAFAYMSAVSAGNRSTWRLVLARLGAFAVLPTAILLGASAQFNPGAPEGPAVGSRADIVAWVLALALPFGLAYLMRRREAWYMLPGLVWVLALGQIDAGSDSQFLLLLALYALGSIGIVGWGLRERYALFVNIGIAGFFLTIVVFYFASGLFDKLGRALGLIVAGLVFIGGGLLLERARRKLIGQIDLAVP
ncbi:MAG: DUF2157 domain-containing protein [Actinomycetota bacterium]